MKAYIFTGQGSQFVGMGKDLFETSDLAVEYFERANDILGFDLTGMMFGGDSLELKKTSIAQPAIFLHSIVLAKTNRSFRPDMVAGHSLGEFSALVANRTLSFGDGLKLVRARAIAMQEACEMQPSGMAAVLGLEDEAVEEVCAGINDLVVVPANYNCPGQLVISGSLEGIKEAGERLADAGARRTLKLNVAGAFHSPLMEPAQAKLEEALDQVRFKKPFCPVYQNVDAQPVTDPEVIKENLKKQLCAPVRWQQTILNMNEDGARSFVEIGPKPVLSGMVRKITGREMTTALTSALV